MSTPTQPYPCPCCGYLVFAKPPGSFDICPICYWEDSYPQLNDPYFHGGPNGGVSLIEAQQNYAAMGSSQLRFKPPVGRPGPGDVRDPGWRPLNPESDIPEHFLPDGSWETFFRVGDWTVLYWWRPTYWRRK